MVPAAPADDGPAFKRGIQLMLITGIAAFAVLFFFQTRDPMILFFGVVAAAMLWLVMSLSGRPGGWGAAQVRVKCRSCGALNLEDAKYCSACGKSM